MIKVVRQHVLSILDNPQTSHLRRAAIGDWLAHTGDPRPGVGLRDDGLPDLVWCPVSAGQVHLREMPNPFPVERFMIARYPVTWKQYRIFLEAEDGHTEPAWWDDLERREEYERTTIPLDNYPAQEVSWYDAVAYCRWLSTKLGYEVRLPTEWEWQQAATGGESEQVYLFPWGNEWIGHYANTRESGLRRVTAVGMYPGGESPVGAVDMAGTVLEWCANEFTHPANIAPGPAYRVMRGGSWFQIGARARTFHRAGDNPYFRFDSVGFRLAMDTPPQKPRYEPTPPIEPYLPDGDSETNLPAD